MTIDSNPGRLAKTGQFWMATCDYNILHRNAPQLDAPWSYFTQDRTRLVSTLWSTGIVQKTDQAGVVRRFAVLAGKSRSHRTSAIQKIREDKERWVLALQERLPIYGFVTLPRKPKKDAIKVAAAEPIDWIFMDHVFQLVPFGTTNGLPLNKEEILASIEAATEEPWRDAVHDGHLVELVEAKGDIPGLHWLEPAHPPRPRKVLLPDYSEGSTGVPKQLALDVAKVLVDTVLQATDDELPVMNLSSVSRKLRKSDAHDAHHERRLQQAVDELPKMIAAATANWSAQEQPPLLTSALDWMPVGQADDSDADAKRRAALMQEHQQVVAYGALWLKVLEALGLPPTAPSGGRGGGESQEHRWLRRHVLDNPNLVGVDQVRRAETEYGLLSGDRLDVWFENELRAVAVEVKSFKSGDEDLQRGVYQAVKYRAVLNAQEQAVATRPPREVESILVVQRNLPPELDALAKMLDVPVVLILSA